METAVVNSAYSNNTQSLTVFFVMLLLCCAEQVNAESPDLWVLTHLEPPFSQQNERGKFEGVAIDITNGILHEAKIEQQILAAPWERVFKEADSKANVMIIGLARIPERADIRHRWDI